MVQFRTALAANISGGAWPFQDISSRSKDRAGTDNLATALPFVVHQRLALDGESTPLVVGKRNAFPTSGLGIDLPEHANLLHEVLDPSRHPLVDAVRPWR